jgi:SsrA-binding protein
MGKKEASSSRGQSQSAARLSIKDVYEAGMVLVGTEVKSLRAGKGNLKDAYAVVKGGEVWVNNFHISPYEKGNQFNHEPLRPKKLLLHKAEINKLLGIQKESAIFDFAYNLFKNACLKWIWR